MTEEMNTGTAPPPPPPAPPPPGDPVTEAKGTAWLSYLGILWLIPMLTLKENPFAKFHVKQGIILTLAWVAWGVLWIIWWIPIIGWLLSTVVAVALLVLAIIGIIKSLGGEYWKLPWGLGALAEKWFKF